MQAFTYARELKDATVEDQRRAVQDACRRDGLDIAEAFADSAGDHAAFHQLVRQIEGCDGAVVAVAQRQALGDRVRDQITRMLQITAVGATLRFAEGDAAAILLDAWRERQPDERRRERARESMRRRALRGQVLGRPPYGYRVEGRRLRVDAAEAEVVREIFRRCLDDDAGVRRITAALNDRGARTRRGGPWSTAGVRDVLRNAVYIGTYARLGVVVPAAHEAIVSAADFRSAEARMAGRRTAPSAQRRRRSYLLAGLARCGYCGNRLIGVRRTGTAAGERVSYQCESATNQGRCGYHTRGAEALERAVRDRLAAGDVQSAEPAASAADEAGRLRARLRGLQRELERMIERWVAGQWRTDRFIARGGPVALAGLEVEERLEAIERREKRAGQDRGAESGAARQRLATDWDSLGFEERRELLRAIVAEIVVTDDAVRVAVTG